MGLFFGRKSRRGSSRRSRLPITRFVGPTVTIVAAVIAVGTMLSGVVDLSSLDPTASEDVATADYQRRGLATDAIMPATLLTKELTDSLQGKPRKILSELRIRVATFNVKQFGPKKAADPRIMDWIARLVSQFDVIAIQEVHGGDAEPIRALIEQLRSGGADYAATVSEKIGQSERYKEAYAFLWNQRTVQMVPGSDYVVADPGGRMAREPMACSFRCLIPVEDNTPPFSFTLINAHTSPSQVAESATLNEMDVLDDVYLSIAEYSGRTLAEDDIILLGDLNVDAEHLRELGNLPNIRSVGGIQPTNMKGTKTYDHIILNAATTTEFTGLSGVVDVPTELRLSQDDAESISDHRPVWAEFTAAEMGVQTASTTRIIR